MRSARIIDLADEELGREITREVDRIVAGLPEDSSCLVTGSIIEGLGNEHSDIDVYVVHGEHAGANSIAVGMRKSRYVDCEYMTLGSLDKLEKRVATCGVNALPDLPLSALDRYYRVAIAVPALVAVNAAQVFDRFDPLVSCRVLSDWSALTAFQLLSRGACRLAQGEQREAGLLLRYCALWRANSVLAADGEGYPSRKWTPEKAARRYGRESPRYQELVGDLLAPQGGPAALLERMRVVTVLSAPLAAALADRGCRLAPEVRHVRESGRDVLTRGRSAVAEVSGTAAAICRSLAVGGDWGRAVRDLAARYEVPVAEASAAAWHETAALRVAGFLQADPDVPGPQPSTAGPARPAETAR